MADDIVPSINGPHIIPYKYSEPEFLDLAKRHIDLTYGAHYSGKIQTVEYIMSHATTLDYLKGSAIKYIDRFGKKNGKNEEDLFKAVHYLAMMMHYSRRIE